MELMVFDKNVHDLIEAASPLEKIDSGYTFTEGPVFHEGVYYFTDFMVNKIFRYEKGKGKPVLINDNSHFSIGMTYDRVKKRILRCTRDLRAITDLEGNIIVNAYQGIPINGSNDIIVDSRGRIFFSDPLSRKIEGVQIGHSSVFMFEEDKNELTILESALEYPNGLALSPDETILYIADTKTLTVHKMELATRRIELFVQFEESYGPGKPDGFRLDEKGNLYVTGPGGIWLINPLGEKLGLIKMPEVAANLCFDDKGIFITASTSIYRLDTNIPSAV
jgi:gluconolactonase